MDHVWMLAVVLVSAAVGLTTRLGTTDLAYHIRAGASMLAGGHLPGVDAYTFTVAGTPWLDQQWGAQVVMAFAYRSAGWPGVAILHAALIAGTFWLVFLACRARGASARMGAVLTFAGFLVSFPNTGMRPQLIAYPLFAATLWILAGRKEHPRRLWVLPVIVACWANIHGSFVLAPFMIGLAWLEDRRDRATTTNLTFSVGAVALLATLANPWGIGAWRYAIGITTNARILGQIEEWEPTSIRSVAGALFFVSALAVTAYLLRRRGATDVFTLLWLGAFFVLALPALRGVVWWGFVFPVALAGVIAEPDQREDRRGNPALNTLVVVALVALIAVELPWWRDRPDPVGRGSALLQAAPQGLVDGMLRDLPSTSRLFVTPRFASWFEFAAPTHPVFVDSRIELFTDPVWNDYIDLMTGREGWQDILDRWRVDGVVLSTDDTTIASLISKDPAWRLSYRDGLGTVYVRN
jgi:hypothetical protein